MELLKHEPGSHAVLCIVNEEYVIGLAALLASLKAHSQVMPPVYVVDAGLHYFSKLRLAQLTWLKLFADKLLPAGLERVLYLDCDMLVLADISELFRVPLEGRLLAAVRDFGMPCGHTALQQFGWRMDKPYFNAGLLLLDLKKLGLLSSQIKGSLAMWDSALNFHDQDLLNLVCPDGDLLELDYKWNAQGLGSYAAFRARSEPDKPLLFSAAELQQLTAGPAIVHFTGPPAVKPSQFLNPYVPYSAKPWSYLCNHPFKDRWLHYLDRTPWAGWRPSWDTLLEACKSEMQEFVDRVAQQHPDFPACHFLEAVAANLAEMAGLRN